MVRMGRGGLLSAHRPKRPGTAGRALCREAPAWLVLRSAAVPTIHRYQR
jgi:hypothetical protein